MKRAFLVAGLIAFAASISACGSSGEGGSITLPSITRPERSTTVAPPVTDPPPTTPDGTTTTAESPTTSTADGSTTSEVATTTEATTTTGPSTTTSEDVTTTEVATTTEEATTPDVAAPTTSAPAVADADEDAGTPWWPFAVGALVLVALIGLLVARRGRKAAALTARTDAALTESADLATHLAVLTPEGAPVTASQDAARLLSLTTELEAISGQTSDEAHQRLLGQVRQQALALHGAVDSVALSAGAPSEAGIALVREQATLLHTTTTQAQATIFPAPSRGGSGAGAS